MTVHIPAPGSGPCSAARTPSTMKALPVLPGPYRNLPRLPFSHSVARQLILSEENSNHSVSCDTIGTDKPMKSLPIVAFLSAITVGSMAVTPSMLRLAHDRAASQVSQDEGPQVLTAALKKSFTTVMPGATAVVFCSDVDDVPDCPTDSVETNEGERFFVYCTCPERE